MRHIFIVNPAAGKGKHIAPLLENINRACKEAAVEYEIYLTKSAQDASQYVEEVCKKGGRCRFYACGGDGTLNEVALGMYKYPDMQLAVVPCGSGNDYVKNFKGVPFDNIAAQIKGGTVKVDVMKAGDGICVNLSSMGLDSAVAMNMTRYKLLPFVTGSFAYILALVQCFIKNVAYDMCIEVDGEKLPEATYSLAVVGNGSYYGGGFNAAPNASLNDGLFDVVLIKKVTRRRFLSLINIYKQGEHIDNPKLADILIFRRGKMFNMTSPADVVTNLDGECFMARKLTLELMPQAITLAIPMAVAKDKEAVGGRVFA